MRAKLERHLFSRRHWHESENGLSDGANARNYPWRVNRETESYSRSMRLDKCDTKREYRNITRRVSVWRLSRTPHPRFTAVKRDWAWRRMLKSCF